MENIGFWHLNSSVNLIAKMRENRRALFALPGFGVKFAFGYRESSRLGSESRARIISRKAAKIAKKNPPRKDRAPSDLA
jgi:hypothetical protein